MKPWLAQVWVLDSAVSSFLWNVPVEELGMIKDIKANFWLMAKCPNSSRIGPKSITAEEEI